jgi:hypothetical protein
MLGNRAIYKDGWMASTTPLRLPWVTTVGAEPNPDDFKWELYNINEDFSQSNDLAGKEPVKLKELQAAFDVEAKKYNVYPLDSSFAARVDPSIRPSLTRGRSQFTYYPGMIRIPEGSAPDFKNRSWTVAAEITVPGERRRGHSCNHRWPVRRMGPMAGTAVNPSSRTQSPTLAPASFVGSIKKEQSPTNRSCAKPI